MKVLHVINVRWYNATAWYAVTLARGMHETGHRVVVCGLAGKPPIIKSEELGLPVFTAEFNSSNPFKIIKTILKFNKLIKEFKPDAVVCHRGEFFWYLALKKFFTNPLWKLIRVRGDIRPPKGGFFNRFMHNKCADRIVVSGEFIKKRFVENLKTDPDYVKVLFGGVDTDKFKNDKSAGMKVRAEYGFSEDDFVVGIVGRFDPVKGHGVLIKAVGKLYREGMTNIRLIIAGFDAVSRIDDVNRLIESEGVSGVTVITGFRTDIEAVINSFDLGVVSSLGSEAICRVGLEIMACGIPLVVSDTGVLPEIVPNENVYKKEDFFELSEKIKKYSNKRIVIDYKKFTQDFLDCTL